MNIIICGAGRVGYTISKILTKQNHSVTVIDQSSEDIQKINENLGFRYSCDLILAIFFGTLNNVEAI